MRKSYLLGLGLILVVILVGAGGCASVVSEEASVPSVSTLSEEARLSGQIGIICSQQDVGLWVTGEGKVMAVPDIALLQLGVESEASTVAEAQQNATVAMDSVIKVLKGNGISDKDIQTQRFNISPVRKWIKEEEREQIIGYRVTNIVIAKIRQIDKAGVIIDAVTIAGGDLTRVDSIGFTIDDPTPYYNEARQKAVEDAVAKAKQLAKLSRVELGNLIYITEGTAYIPPVRDMYKLEAAAATPISPGEVEVQLTIQMVYEID